MAKQLRYCNNILSYARVKSKDFMIGDTGIGGDYPVVLQSMTNTDTNNIEATAEQCIRIHSAGGHIVRITTPGIKEVEKLANIKAYIQNKGFRFPLVADIHFQPKAAENAARLIEKVRINPGNYTGKSSFESDDTYFAEVRKNLLPLIEIANEYGTAIRIGSNHGSLSERVLNKYGNTPEGMVMAALEFSRIFEDEGFDKLVISMKASDPRVMIYASRLLSAKMIKDGNIYPQHLGVTEAGEGEDGRIKSAIGIGTLLADGIGDTIRVSLTEEPEYEIPVAQKILNYATSKAPFYMEDPLELPYGSFEYKKRMAVPTDKVGSNTPPVVIADFRDKTTLTQQDFLAIGYVYDNNEWIAGDQAADYIWYNGDIKDKPKDLSVISTSPNADVAVVSLTGIEQLYNKPALIHIKTLPDKSVFEKLSNIKNAMLLYETAPEESLGLHRQLFVELHKHNIDLPVIFARTYSDTEKEDLQIKSAVDFGPLFIDGLCDGIMLTAPNLPRHIGVSSAFGILQATKSRITKPEYISCPGCGRTLFDLQKTTAVIKQRTGHLKGIKIGIMGCIVNGPGEMADADYGYVGAGPGRITLYKQQKVMKRAIPEENALEELVALIKENGDWKI